MKYKTNREIDVLENISPYDFLKDKLGRTPNKSEIELLGYILINKRIIPSGVNLIMDYMFKVNNNQLDMELAKKLTNYFKRSSLSDISDYDHQWLNEYLNSKPLNNILVNDFKGELIIYAIAEPNTGHIALNCSTIRKCIQVGKKVLFYSLDLPKSSMLKRIALEDTSKLLIEDRPLNNLEEISFTIDNFKPDLVIIDYFMLLTHDTKVEDILVLHRILRQHDIPFIVVMNLSSKNNRDVEFSTITLEEFKRRNSAILPIIQLSDRFIVFYQKSEKEYMAREMLNDFTGKPKEFDIRDLLN